MRPATILEYFLACDLPTRRSEPNAIATPTSSRYYHRTDQSCRPVSWQRRLPMGRQRQRPSRCGLKGCVEALSYRSDRTSRRRSPRTTASSTGGWRGVTVGEVVKVLEQLEPELGPQVADIFSAVRLEGFRRCRKRGVSGFCLQLRGIAPSTASK